MSTPGLRRENKKNTLRWIKQRDQYSCGVVAVINALKWAGYNATYNKDFKRLKKACKCTFEGTFVEDLDRVIRSYKGLIVLPEDEPMSAPSIKLVDDCLGAGGAIIISYIAKSKGEISVSHLTLCIGKSGKRYVFINDSSRGKTVTKHSRAAFIKMLRCSDTEYGGSDVWFLMRTPQKGK